MSGVAHLALVEQTRLLQARQIKPLDLVDAALARIESLDPELHAVTQVFADEARARARALERETARGGVWGVPWLAKDIVSTRLGRTTCGSRILDPFRAAYDATVVARLEKAGAILLGKTNMDEFAMGSSTENSGLGPTRNPWNTDCVPGGSSGGSTAAVAADMATFALGSDTGGSIRQPAGFCGVVGLKPTYGRVSRFGLVAFASSLDQLGPITKTAADAAVVLGTIAGHDPRDATSSGAPVPDYAREIGEECAGLRIGVPRRWVEGDLAAGPRADFERCLELARASGARLLDVELPHAEHAIAVYYIVATAEASSNLARYDGVRYGARAEGAGELGTLLQRTRNAGFGAEVKRRILLGTYVLSAGYYDAYYLRAQKVRTLIRRDFDAAFAACDVIAVPTSPGPAFKLGAKSDDPLEMYLSDIYTVPANLAGLPAISLPTRCLDGLPLGVQLYAPVLGEPVLLRAAHWLESLLGFERLVLSPPR